MENEYGSLRRESELHVLQCGGAADASTLRGFRAVPNH